MKRKILLLFAIMLSALCNLNAQSKGKIAWMGNDLKADSLYLVVLKNAGYDVVDKTATKGDLTVEQIADLNSYDLIIMSRASNSADYQFPTKYNSITAPIMNLSCLVARSNPTRWNMLPSNAGGEASKTDVMAVINKDHPIFTGVSLADKNTLDFVITGPLQALRVLGGAKSAGKGNLIGVTAKDSLVVLAEWAANTPYFEGSTDIPMGKRMVFFAPFGYQLNDQGNKLLLNIAEYMISGSVIKKSAHSKVIFITENVKSDSLYIDLLLKNNCEIKVVTNLLNVTPSDSAMAVLEASDVIIFSRNTTSGGYQALTQYNKLATPIMLMSAYMARSSRWQVLETPNAVDNDADTVNVLKPTHTIFDGISLAPANKLVLTLTQKIGTCAANSALNATVIASASKSGNIVIAEWKKNTKFYDNSANSAVGHRMVFFLTGIYDLTPNAQTVFVNSVKYLATFDYDTVIVANEAPTNLTLSNSAIDENKAIGWAVGVLSASDAAGTTLTYSLVAGDGKNDVDNNKFAISGDALKTSKVLDFETQKTYKVNIQVSDGELTSSKAFVIILNDIVEVGISEISSNYIQIYPNPFADKFCIKSMKDAQAKISVYNITGQAVYQKVHSLNNVIELKLQIPSGIYIVNMTGENVQYNYRLIHK